MSARSPRSARKTAEPEPILEGVDASLLDIVDHVLSKGVVLTGDLLLGVADVDLVYLRLSAVLCAADRVLGPAARPRRRATRRGLLVGISPAELAADRAARAKRR